MKVTLESYNHHLEEAKALSAEDGWLPREGTRQTQYTELFDRVQNFETVLLLFEKGLSCLENDSNAFNSFKLMNKTFADYFKNRTGFGEDKEHAREGPDQGASTRVRMCRDLRKGTEHQRLFTHSAQQDREETAKVANDSDLRHLDELRKEHGCGGMLLGSEFFGAEGQGGQGDWHGKPQGHSSHERCGRSPLCRFRLSWLPFNVHATRGRPAGSFQ